MSEYKKGGKTMRKGEMMHKILGIALVLSVMLGTLGGTGWADNVRAEAAGTVEPHNECVVFTLEAKTAMAGISVCAAALTENSANATISNEMVLDDVSTPTAATTYTVHPTDPSADFTTIQAAVDAASPGDNIEVWNSTYGEHITVNKQLSIYSRDGAAVTLVDGSDVGSCFYVTANGVSITGFTVQNGEYGIRLCDSNYSTVTENTVRSNNNYGISLRGGCVFTEISDNMVTSNQGHGIYMDGGANNNLIGNTVTSNDDHGIYLWASDENEVANNTIEFNDSCGIHVDAENNILTENSISHNGDYGIYMWGDNNLFYNNYVNNAKNAAASGTHYWNITKTEGTNIIGGPYLGGNYWSDYTGEDLDGDGLGDTELPYNSGGSIANGGDYLPLVLPGAINIVYLKPEDSCAPFCCTRDVEIRVNATDFQAGQIKLVYNSSCADVSDWVRNEDDFPLGTWDSDIPGEELITFSSLEPLTGDYPIGTLSIHCVSEEERATALDFVEDGATGSALFDNTGSEMPAIWEDGTFECVLRICGDVAPLPCCDGIVNMGDVVLLLNYVGHPSEYQLCCDWSGDVAPCPASDGTINMGDVVLLLNYVGHPGEYQLCCE
jgi:parallel beta-helix repeat protein